MRDDGEGFTDKYSNDSAAKLLHYIRGEIINRQSAGDSEGAGVL